MAAKPFESRIQNLVYNVDVGVGFRLIKFGLYLLFVLITMLLYTATQFRGLKDAEAMDYAQLGRNLVLRGRLVTQCVRPLSMWYLIENAPSHNPMLTEHPDILHPPLWPALLAAGFKATRTNFGEEQPGGIHAPEQWVIIPLCHLFTLLTGLLVFLLGRRLFDPRVGLLAVTVYFLSDTTWSTSISGLNIPLAVFLCAAAFFAILVAAAQQQADRPARTWMVPYALAALLCIAAFLTRYATVAVVPAVVLYIGLQFRNRRWVWAGIFVAVFVIGVTPWLVRNQVVSGSPLGLAPYTALNETGPYEESRFERNLTPAVTPGRVLRELQTKSITELARLYNVNLRTVGDGLLICLFVTAFFYRFVRTPVHWFRWCLALAAGLLLFLGSLFGDTTVRLTAILWPFVIIYGLAFFLILLDRLQLRVRLYNLAVTTTFIFLCALPLIFTMLPPRTGIPYPPYFPPFITHVSRMLAEDEMMCSDMPWATAWYGNRTSLLLPATLDEFYEINDYNKRISGLYFTTLTRNKPWVRGLMTGTERSWYPLLEGRIPADFPLTQGFPLNNMDQLFLTDRIRW